ncbi:hypothetical protein SH580_06350 [Coraliomargarita algicola]|uniref:Uncharacterized protein n=1 Tax=Coraliomargarita algicola TaxID=3092156 RepID=A0ABZ0RR09_9BACT|nr:hypothetical protein [Coraliomargarita sp. J2-16]WPJ97327.1 hypothetical protein SH580_06350 [Coraliomargarita sp. J2-16]
MENKKTKVLLVIAGDLFVRNYIRSGVAHKISEAFQLSIIANDACSLKADLESAPNFSGYFKTDPKHEAAHYNYFTLLIFRYRNRSKTFPFRLKRDIGWNLPDEAFSRIKKLKLLLKKGKRGREARRCVLQGNRLLFRFYKKRIEAKLPINQDLSQQISEIRPDILLFPSSAYDPAGNDVARICKKLGIKSVYLIDNWDNLSSKSVFWARPDFLGVWSEQHQEHAIRIHGFESSRVYPIGTPRFDDYFSQRGATTSKPFDFPYVVFSGCCLPFDETTALKALDQEIREHPEIYNELRIVYRPHPWRQKRKAEATFIESEFTHVVLDPQIRDQFLSNSENMSEQVSFQPSTDYYPLLLDNAQFVCGPLTTFLLESLIFKKHYIGLSYDDGTHITSPHNAFKYYEMYKGIDKHPGVTLVHNIQLLTSSFRTTFETYTPNCKEYKSWDKALNYYLRIDDSPYPQRLTQLIKAVEKDS